MVPKLALKSLAATSRRCSSLDGVATATARLIVGLTATLLALVFVEAAARAIDGYSLSTVRLRPVRPPRSRPATDSGKWLDPDQGATYASRLVVAPGVDKAWFALGPEARPAHPVDRALDERYWKSRGFELPSVYAWNLQFVKQVLCEGDRSIHPYLAGQLQHLADVFVYDPPDGRPYPTYRFLPNAHYPSGLVTNALGYRGPEVPVEKPSGRVRIAFVGASTTAGAHGDPFSYPEYVARWLTRWSEARHLPITFDVINAGREGITSTSIAAIVRQELVPLEPDFVVYYEGTNQFWPNTFTPRPLIPLLRWMDARPLDTYSAVAVRTESLLGFLNSGTSGAEPHKPPVPVDWPADLNETDPVLSDPRLPVQLPTILGDLDDIRRSLASRHGTLVVSSFVWLVHQGLNLDRQRDVIVYRELNERYWPFSYAHLRRFVDFENRVFRKYAAAHGNPFNEVADQFPQDPRLFVDSVHLTPAGVKLQAWITFQNLVPILERALAANQLPATQRERLEGQPAFHVPPARLTSLNAIRQSCRP